MQYYKRERGKEKEKGGKGSEADADAAAEANADADGCSHDVLLPVRVRVAQDIPRHAFRHMMVIHFVTLRCRWRGVDDLIQRLTLEEKPSLLIARNSPRGNVSRFGVPEYDWGGNCIHGVQSRCYGDRCPAIPIQTHLAQHSMRVCGMAWVMSLG